MLCDCRDIRGFLAAILSLIDPNITKSVQNTAGMLGQQARL